MRKRLLTGLMALLLSSPLWAADPVYEVEVVVFSKNAAQINATALSNHKPALNSGFSLDLLGGLPLETSMLDSAVAKLKANGNYTVLLHQAWRQPVGAAATAPALRLASGSVQGESGSVPELEGLVRLYRSPALVMDVDMLLRKSSDDPATSADNTQVAAQDPQGNESQYVGSNEPAAPSPAPEPAPQAHKAPLEIPFAGSNKLNDNEVAYFDGPVIGVLAQVKPIQTP